MKDDKKPVFHFKRNTIKDEPKKFVMGVLTVFFVHISITYMFDSGLAIIAMILTIISLPEIFFPFTYTIFEDSIIVNRFFYKVRKNLSYYKKVYNDKNGIFLSPYRMKTRMESFRGILLRVAPEQKKEVYEFLYNKIEAPYKEKEKEAFKEIDKQIEKENSNE